MMLERMGVRTNDPEFKRVDVELQRGIRASKETLFTRGIVYFNDGAQTIKRDEFVMSDGVQRFATALKSKFEQTLNGVDESFLVGLHESGLKVVLTGGGATLPMVEALAQGTAHAHGQTLMRDKASMVPEAFKKHPIAAEYPQLAVAIGGASSELPDLRKSLDRFRGARTNNVVVTRY
jgi:molecular chaperone HscA